MSQLILYHTFWNVASYDNYNKKEAEQGVYLICYNDHFF